MDRDSILNSYTLVANRLKHVVDLVDLSSINSICDIGSWHLGQSIEFLEISPNCKVYAFEANPENYELCKKIHSSLPDKISDNIKIYNKALNNENGIIKFYPVTESNRGASSKYKLIEDSTKKYFKNCWKQKEIDVEAITLDSWREENKINSIDLLWVDVQGAELDVFKGASETLQDVKCILTEVGLDAYYQGQSLKPDIDEFLKDLGFYELEESFEYNGSECEANTIYIKK